MDCFNNIKQDKTIILYHGGTDVIEKPYIKSKGNYGDFGFAFYLTDKRWKAGEWATRAKRKRNKDKGIINVYKLNLDYDSLNIKVLDTIDYEWADYIVKGRTGLLTGYDIIIGKVADDQVWGSCLDFIEQRIPLELFLHIAKANKDKN